MSKKIEFRITEPCHQNWEKMGSVEQGKFCMACKKTVIDFSTMSDQEILLQISKSNRDICGRFVPDQLNREMVIDAKKKTFWWKYSWNMILAAFLISSEATAQRKPTPGREKFVDKPDKPIFQFQRMGFVHTVQPAKKRIASVVDADDTKPVPFATIKIKPANIRLSADSAGNFEYATDLNQQNQYLEISAVGYESKIISVESDTSKNSQPYTFQLTKKFDQLAPVTVVAYTPISCEMLPQVMIENRIEDTLVGIVGGLISIQSKTIVEKVKDTVLSVFTNNNLQVFPNPVISGSTMHVRFDFKQMGNYELRIINVSGQILDIEMINVQMKNQVKQIFIPATYTKGVYFLKVQKHGSSEVSNKKFIVR